MLSVLQIAPTSNNQGQGGKRWLTHLQILLLSELMPTTSGLIGGGNYFLWILGNK